MKIGTTLGVLLVLAGACGSTHQQDRQTATVTVTERSEQADLDTVKLQTLREQAAEQKKQQAQQQALQAHVAVVKTMTVPDMIVQAFSPLGPGATEWALRVARCESGYNPQAMNPSGDATGVFQFLRATWALTPYASYSRTDPWANVQAAAWLYVHGGPGNWVCK